MNPSHHLDHATLIARASGTLPRALAIVVDCHLEFCAVCRSGVKNANEFGGALLHMQQPEPVSTACKEAIMGRIGSATVHRLPVAQPTVASDVPLALQGVLRCGSLDEIEWQRAAPGLQICRLPKDRDEAVFFGLFRIAPGSRLPDHGHGGTELTLVLKGTYQDELGQFGRGDIADHDESIEHSPVVSGDEPCICLVASESAARFRSWPARLIQRFIGI